MIIVAGHLLVKPGSRDEFIEKSISAITQARALETCLDFSVAPDPIVSNRVNVFEKWTSLDSLEKFRGTGPDDGQFQLVESFAVEQFTVDS